MSNSTHRHEQSGVYTPAMLPEPIYVAVPHQLPPRVHHGHPPEDSHDLHALHECRTVDDLEALAVASGPGGIQLRHQAVAVAVIARRELDRLLGRVYRIAVPDGHDQERWHILHEIRAASDSAAEAEAERRCAGTEHEDSWYVLDEHGNNVNG